jgi:IS30 family transposase
MKHLYNIMERRRKHLELNLGKKNIRKEKNMKQKLTKEQIELIKKLKEEGKTTYEIAKQFNVCQNTIMYWTSNRDKQIKRNSDRIKNMSKEERHKIYLKQYEYRKNYFRTKYQTDQEFRKKVIERVIKYQRRKKNA